MKRCIALLIPLCLGGCAQDATGPLDTSLAMSATGAVVVSGTGTYTFDNTFPNPCLGENVHVWGETNYRYHRVETPSGNIISTTFDLEPIEWNFVGEPSGTVWLYRRSAVSPQISITTRASVYQMTNHAWFENAAGQRFFGVILVHMGLNANGELTVMKVVLDQCKISR